MFFSWVVDSWFPIALSGRIVNFLKFMRQKLESRGSHWENKYLKKLEENKFGRYLDIVWNFAFSISKWFSKIVVWKFFIIWLFTPFWRLRGVKFYLSFFLHFYPAEFTPDGVLSSLYSYVRPYVRPSEIFFEIFGFLGSSRW